MDQIPDSDFQAGTEIHSAQNHLDPANGFVERSHIIDQSLIGNAGCRQEKEDDRQMFHVDNLTKMFQGIQRKLQRD